MKMLDWISEKDLVSPYNEWIDPNKRPNQNVLFIAEYVSKSTFTIIYGFFLVMFVFIIGNIIWMLPNSKDVNFDLISLMLFVIGSFLLANNIIKSRRDFSEYQKGIFRRGIYISENVILINHGPKDIFVIHREAIDQIEKGFEAHGHSGTTHGSTVATLHYHEPDGTPYKMDIDRNHHFMRSDIILYERLSKWFAQKNWNDEEPQSN
jgi:hypothetical protein